jgi:hypothetical protein
MPGVTISTAVRTGAVNTGTAPAATFFVVGQTERGADSQAVLVTSLEDYESKFGGHVTGHYTWYTLRTFFEEGGVQAYVARATAAAAVNASVALAAPSTQPGITLTAVGAGTWGNSLEATVVNNTINFDLTVTYADAEVFSGLGFASLAEAVTAINFSSTASNYFSASLTSGASGSSLLAAVSESAFTSGTNGTIAKSDYVSALGLFTNDLGSGAVSIPGVATGSSDAALYDGLRAHAYANNRIALCSFSGSASLAQARSASTGYTGTQHHEYMAFYHPWVEIPNGTVTVSIPPDGYVAAVRSRTHNEAGPWKAFAGVASEAKFVSGLSLTVSRADADGMEGDRVNPLRLANGRVRVYGARSHSTLTAQWRFINARDVINYIVTQAESKLDDLVFSTIDGRSVVFANIINALQSVLEPIRIAGGLYEGFDALGKRLDYGYTIKCDAALNPASQLETGKVRARVGVRISSIGDKIEVDLIKSNLTTALE